MKVTMLATRHVPKVGLLETDQSYNLDSGLANQLIRQGLAYTLQPTTKKRSGKKGSIDLSDGVSDEEASLAARTLSQRSNEED